MKKLLIIFLSALSLTAVAQQKVAVYVTGEQSGINKVLGDQLVAAFAKSGQYTAVERTASFLSELSKEQGYQRSGSVSDSEIARLGEQFGVNYVCVVDISDVFEKKYISARLIDVLTAEIVNTANESSQLNSMEELIRVSNVLKSQLFNDYSTTSQAPQDYVDLGLPSGTLWKAENEDCGLITYDQAVNFYRTSLPTKEQWEELKNFCLWTWTGNGYRIKGKSGESIFLPAEGFRDCGGSHGRIGSRGYYWSSTPNSSENAWGLYFASGEVRMLYFYRCYGLSVRLVR